MRISTQKPTNPLPLSILTNFPPTIVTPTLGCVLGCFSAAISAAVYYDLSGEWSLSATLIGFAGSFIVVTVGIQLAWRMPIEQLASLETRCV